MKKVVDVEDALSWYEKEPPMRYQVIDRATKIYITENVYVYALLAQFEDEYDVVEFVCQKPSYAYYDMDGKGGGLDYRFNGKPS